MRLGRERGSSSSQVWPRLASLRYNLVAGVWHIRRAEEPILQVLTPRIPPCLGARHAFMLATKVPFDERCDTVVAGAVQSNERDGL